MAFFQDPQSRQPFLRVPVPILLLIGLLVAIYAVQATAPTLTANAIIDRYSFIPARYSSHFMKVHFVAPQSIWDQAVPFVSYMFLHGGLMHLLINIVWLLPFGSIVARRMGGILFILFFIVCGVAGAVAFLVTNWGLAVPVVGASGAISGLMAVAFRMIRYPFTPDAAASPLAPIFSMQILLWSVVWVAINVVAGLTGIGAGPGPQAIAWQVHLGGYFVGLFLAGPFLALHHRMHRGPQARGAAA